MKKKNISIENVYKCPHIYLDDLEDIIEIFKEANITNINIETKDYTYSDLTDISKELTSINGLKLYSTNPHIYINFLKNYSNIYIPYPDIISLGIFTKINLIIKKRERKILWIYCKLIYITSAILLLLTIIILLLKINLSIITFSTILFFAIILGPTSISFRFYHYSKIEFFKLNNLPNFFKRNKEWLIPIIAAITGSIITFILTYIFIK